MGFNSAFKGLNEKKKTESEVSNYKYTLTIYNRQGGPRYHSG